MKIYRGEDPWAGRYLLPIWSLDGKLGCQLLQKGSSWEPRTHSEVVLGLETLAGWATLHTLDSWG